MDSLKNVPREDHTENSGFCFSLFGLVPRDLPRANRVGRVSAKGPSRHWADVARRWVHNAKHGPAMRALHRCRSCRGLLARVQTHASLPEGFVHCGLERSLVGLFSLCSTGLRDHRTMDTLDSALLKQHAGARSRTKRKLSYHSL